MQGSVVESLSQTDIGSLKCFLFWNIKLSPPLTIHNTGISLLLSTNMRVIFLKSPPIERREID